MAQAAQRYVELKLLAPPLIIPPFPVYMNWHERSHHDVAHAWFRFSLAQVARGEEEWPTKIRRIRKRRGAVH